MLIIQNYIISDELLTEEFACNLSKCKGACCWEGDFGAPLNAMEIDDIENSLDPILPLLPQQSRALISEQGFHRFYKEKSIQGTQLLSNGACVFLAYEDNGCASCSIEKAYKSGKIKFNKPISCHLYPIRIHEDPFTGIEMLQYDRWEICHAACSLGKSLKIPVYEFLKEAIVRKFGISFYEELQAAAGYLKTQKPTDNH